MSMDAYEAAIAAAYARGRDEDRADVVAWLRITESGFAHYAAATGSELFYMSRTVCAETANGIETGAHVGAARKGVAT